MKNCLLILLLIPAHLFAQLVTNVTQEQNGDIINVYYDLSEEANITLYCSIDGGNTYRPVSGQYVFYDGHNYPGTHKRLEWRVLDQYESFQYEDVRFKVVASKVERVSGLSEKYYESRPSKKQITRNAFNPEPTHQRFYLLADFAWSPSPQYSGGFMLGTVQKLGWYMKLHLSFTPSYYNKAQKSNSEYGLIEPVVESTTGLMLPAFTGKDNRFSMVLSAGFVARLGIPLYAYVGLGYGSRQLYWEAVDSHEDTYWVNLTPYSHRGVAVDAGLMFDIWHIRFKAGVTTINFGYIEYDFGLGFVL